MKPYTAHSTGISDRWTHVVLAVQGFLGPLLLATALSIPSIAMAQTSGSPASGSDVAAETGLPSIQLLWSRLGDLNGQDGAVESAEFSPDGRFIVSGSKYDNRVMVWRVDDGSKVWEREADGEVERAAWSPDGKYIVSTGEDETLRLWRATDGKPLATILLNAGVDGMAFSPDGKILVTGKEEVVKGKGGVVQAWAMPNLKLLRSTTVTGTVNSITFTRDGQLVLTGGAPNHVHVLRVADLSLVRSLVGVPDQTVSSVREDSGLVAASAKGGYVCVWQLADGKKVAQFNHTNLKVEAVEWTNDGQFLLVAGKDPHIRIVRRADLGLNNVPAVFVAPKTGPVEYLDFSPNGGSLVSCGEDGTVRLWLWELDVDKGQHKELMKRQKAASEKRQAERAAKGVKSL